jgi:hypothetical protein
MEHQNALHDGQLQRQFGSHAQPRLYYLFRQRLQHPHNRWGSEAFSVGDDCTFQ